MSETIEKPISETLDTPSGVSEIFFNKLVGINEAAVISRASKGQLSKDSSGGRIQFTLNEKGYRQYKVAHLYQKYGFRNQQATSTESEEKPQEIPQETIKAAVELAVLKERNSRLEAENQDLRQNRDKLLDQNNRLTMLLTAPVQSTAPLEAAAPLSFWQKLFSSKSK